MRRIGRSRSVDPLMRIVRSSRSFPRYHEQYTNLIKDELGAAAYNKITKAIRADNEVKERYESILEEVKAENAQQTEESGQLDQQGQDGEDTEMGKGTDAIDQSSDINQQSE
jgi:hypothetical protein